MAWSPGFLARLNRKTGVVKAVVRTYTINNEPGASWAVASHPVDGADQVGLIDFDCEAATGEMRVGKVVLGGFTFTILGDSRRGGLECLQYWTRGTVLELLVAFEDTLDLGDFVRVALGQLVEVSGVAPYFQFVAMDFTQVLKQRQEVGYGLTTLFSDIGTTTTLASAYTPGDTTLTVNDVVTAWARQTGGTGAVKVTPSSGDPFYLTYTGTATGPDRFTGVSVVGRAGSTAVAASSGDLVTEVAWLEGHPIDILRRVLASTGAGTNGPWDDLPTAWGLGMPNTLIDSSDMDDERDAMEAALSSGTLSLELVVEENGVADGFDWVETWLVGYGINVVQRQGQLTVRRTQDPNTASTVAMTLDDDDIEEIAEWTAWDEGFYPEYQVVQVTAPNGLGALGTTTDAATIPNDRQVEWLLVGLYDNESAVAEEVLSRIETAFTRIPERLVLRLHTLAAAQLSRGDIVEISSTRSHSRRDGKTGWSSRRAWVAKGPRVVWREGWVELTVNIFPEDEDVYS